MTDNAPRWTYEALHAWPVPQPTENVRDAMFGLRLDVEALLKGDEADGGEIADALDMIESALWRAS